MTESSCTFFAESREARKIRMRRELRGFIGPLADGMWDSEIEKTLEAVLAARSRDPLIRMSDTVSPRFARIVEQFVPRHFWLELFQELASEHTPDDDDDDEED